MKIILSLLFCLTSLSAGASAVNRIVFEFSKEENKAEWIRLGCLKADLFVGTAIYHSPETTVALENNACFPHRYGYRLCFEGDIKVAEIIVNKMIDNSNGHEGYYLVSKNKIVKENDSMLIASYQLKKTTESDTYINNQIQNIPRCK